MCLQRIYNRVLSFYNTYRKNVEKRDPKKAQGIFVYACDLGDLNTVKEYLPYSSDYVSGLILATKQGFMDIVQYLVSEKNTAENVLSDLLEIACKFQRYTTAEFLVQKGADIYRGLRATDAKNITRMLYRYKNGVENITE